MSKASFSSALTNASRVSTRTTSQLSPASCSHTRHEVRIRDFVFDMKEASSRRHDSPVRREGGEQRNMLSFNGF